jgi:hypothetical protein
MSGLFRRLRRRKTADDEGEAAEPPAGDDAPSDPDIYPHRAPAAEGDPDIVAEPEVASPDATVTGEDTESEVSPAPPESEPAPHAPTPSAEPRGPAEEVRPAVPEVRPAVEVPAASGPPPLPAVDEDVGRAAHRPLTAPTRCFLCGTEMAGSFCPTCRMTWNE